MNFTKNSKGITLVALVVTIIVLLILAGVALSLVSGGDGILNRASNAANRSNEEAAKEQVMLKMAEYKAEYYDEMYVNKNIDVNTKLGDWIAKNKTGEIQTQDYKFTITGDKAPYAITILKNNSLKTEIAGTLSAEGKIELDEEIVEENGETPEQPESKKYTLTYNTNGGTGELPADAQYEENEEVTISFPELEKEGYKFVGWATTSDATEAIYTSEGSTTLTITENITLYAVWQETFASQITTDNYGDYVDLETSLIVNDNIALEDGTYPTTDWRIFHEDADGGVYLILADYLPYSYEETTVGAQLISYNPYNWHSTTSRSDLIQKLKGTSAEYNGKNPWNNLISSTYTEKGISVTGALSLETWLESWHAKGYTQLFTNKYSDKHNGAANSDGLDGYYIGIDESQTSNMQDISSLSTAGYANSLYFPHKDYTARNNAHAYRLASPSAGYSNNLMSVYYNGVVGDRNQGVGIYGIRPAIYLPSGIEAEQDATTKVWSIK